MPVTQEHLDTRIREIFQDKGLTHLEIHDISGGCGQSFEVTIVATEFEKPEFKLTRKRHQLVFKELESEIAQIHAFNLKTLTPKQAGN